MVHNELYIHNILSDLHLILTLHVYIYMSVSLYLHVFVCRYKLWIQFNTIFYFTGFALYIYIDNINVPFLFAVIFCVLLSFLKYLGLLLVKKRVTKILFSSIFGWVIKMDDNYMNRWTIMILSVIYVIILTQMLMNIY